MQMNRILLPPAGQKESLLLMLQLGWLVFTCPKMKELIIVTTCQEMDVSFTHPNKYGLLPKHKVDILLLLDATDPMTHHGNVWIHFHWSTALDWQEKFLLAPMKKKRSNPSSSTPRDTWRIKSKAGRMPSMAWGVFSAPKKAREDEPAAQPSNTSEVNPAAPGWTNKSPYWIWWPAHSPTPGPPYEGICWTQPNNWCTCMTYWMHWKDIFSLTLKLYFK